MAYPDMHLSGNVFFFDTKTHAGKGLTAWLLFVMFNVFLLFSHVVSWVRRGA